MSQGIWITKTGFRATEWDGELREYVDKPIHSLLHFLRGACHIEEGVTLGDIIERVAGDPFLTTLVGEYSWCDVAAFRDEARKPPEKKSDLKWIAISRHFEIHERSKYHTHAGDAGDIEDSLNVSGRDDTDTRWAIDFTPVNEMAHLPVRLNPVAKVDDWRGSEYKTIAIGETGFSFLDVITEIFFEISFHGSPSQRNETRGEVMARAEEVRNGTAKLVPFEIEEETVQ